MNVPGPLISDIAQGRCLPFLGAGFSKNAELPSGLDMPDWSQLGELLADHVETEPGEEPTKMAQSYERRFGRVQLIETIRAALHTDDARPGDAHKLFVQLPFETIYTTNFDLLLEDAYADAARPFRSLVGELQLPFHAGQIASNIIKMHGDLRHEEHLIITQSDYDSYMDRYPVVATHLSAMLITRTPLFLGYSLSDPDLNHIRQVVRSRLGDFERIGYMVQFDAELTEIEKALEERIHIISLSSSSAESRGAVLAAFFHEVQNQLDTAAGLNLRNSRPDAFEEVEPEHIQKAVSSSNFGPILEATSKLCFVMMPFGLEFDEVYRLLITSAVKQLGLSVVRADEMISTGTIMEQIRTAIQQSRLCIADLTGTNSNVLYEIGYAQALGKPIVLIARKDQKLPFNVAHQRVIFYEEDLAQAKKLLIQTLWKTLSSDRLEAAKALLDVGQFGGGVVLIVSVLEQHLRQALREASEAKRAFPVSLGRMSREAAQAQILPVELVDDMEWLVHLRNRVVHEMFEPPRAQAELALEVAEEILSLESLQLEWPENLSD